MSTTRTTFRFNNKEAEFAERLKNPTSDEAAAVRELTGHEPARDASIVTLTHAMVEAGMLAIRNKAEEVGRTRLAEFLKDDPEHRAWRNSRRKRTEARHTETAS